MGLSLVGNSGDQKTTNDINETSYTGSSNPQLDLQDSGAGATALSLDPFIQGGGIGYYAPDVSTNYAPVNISTTGDNYGDAALAAIQGIVTAQTQASEAAPAATSSTALPASISGLLSGSTLYWLLAAVVVLLLTHHKH